MKEYDAIIIGAGQGAKPLAIALAKARWKVALVEREHLGGTCINVGCTPTKTMVASARAAYVAGRAERYGVRTETVSVNMAKVRERKRAMVADFRAGTERALRGAEGLELLMGEATFTGPRSLRVMLVDGGTAEITAPKIFLNTGGRPAVPDVGGVPALDSTSIMELDHVPDHLIVLGGGYVGLEFGQMFRRFGSRVSIVQRGSHVLAREDPDVADEVASILREDGVDIFLDSEAVKAETSGTDKVQVSVRTTSGERTLVGSHLLAASGRVPNTERLNLPAAGVETDKRGFIKVNEYLETNVSGVYALGDVKGGPQFTHISYDDFRILKANLLEQGQSKITGRLVPYAVFIDPQLGRIGMTEAEARQEGFNVGVAKIPMTYVARAIEVDEPRGFMKAIVDVDSGQILGAAVLGIEGGELMAVLQVAMLGRLHYRAIRDAVFAHPTLAESLNTLFGSIVEH